MGFHDKIKQDGAKGAALFYSLIKADGGSHTVGCSGTHGGVCVYVLDDVSGVWTYCCTMEHLHPCGMDGRH